MSLLQGTTCFPFWQLQRKSNHDFLIVLHIHWSKISVETELLSSCWISQEKNTWYVQIKNRGRRIGKSRPSVLSHPGILVFSTQKVKSPIAESVYKITYTATPAPDLQRTYHWLTRSKNRCQASAAPPLREAELNAGEMFLQSAVILASSKQSGHMQWWLEHFHNYFPLCRLICTLEMLECSLILKWNEN